MHVLRVDDMTCGHCVSTITKAADRNAKVTIDLSQHLAMVEPTEADAQGLEGCHRRGCVATAIAAHQVPPSPGCAHSA